MDSFDKKRRWRNFTNSKIVLFILAVLIVLLGKSTWNLYGKSQEASISKERLIKESKELEARQAFLQKELESLKSEEGIEKSLKQKFNIKKEGEEVFVIVDSKIEDEASQRSDKKSWFGSFFSNLFDIFW